MTGVPAGVSSKRERESAGFAPTRRFASSQGGHSPVPSSALSVTGGPPAQNAGLGAVVRLGLSALRTALLGRSSLVRRVASLVLSAIAYGERRPPSGASLWVGLDTRPA